MDRVTENPLVRTWICFAEFHYRSHRRMTNLLQSDLKLPNNSFSLSLRTLLNVLNFSLYKTNNVVISLAGILTSTDENEGSRTFPVTEMRITVCINYCGPPSERHTNFRDSCGSLGVLSLCVSNSAIMSLTRIQSYFSGALLVFEG